MRSRCARCLAVLALGLLVTVTACTNSVSGTPTAALITAAKDLRFRPVMRQVATTAISGGTSSATDRQPTETAGQTRELDAYTCHPGRPDPLAGQDDPGKPLITCDRAGKTKYLLGPTVLDGTDTRTASAAQDPNGAGYVVNLSFDAAGTRIWAAYTASHVNQAIAVVANTDVVSAPTIEEAIPGGNTQISGNFTQQQAQQLADALNRR